MTRRRRPAPPLALQLAEIAWAAPQVVAHRSARLALTGHAPSARDRREFTKMTVEKGEAFVESWSAMWWQGLRAQQSLALALWQSATAVSPAPATARSLAAPFVDATLAVLGQGVAPVHRRAVANARRLRHSRLK